MYIVKFGFQMKEQKYLTAFIFQHVALFWCPIDILQFYSRKTTPIITMGIVPRGVLGSDPHFIAFLHFDVSM